MPSHQHDWEDDYIDEGVLYQQCKRCGEVRKIPLDPSPLPEDD